MSLFSSFTKFIKKRFICKLITLLDVGNWNGKLNDIDLKTDIVRYDVEQNIITGSKTITNLMTQDLWTHNKEFSSWAKGALIQKCQKLSVIKGRKTFKNLNLNNLR